MFDKLKSKLKSMRNAKTSAVAIESPIEEPDRIIDLDSALNKSVTVEIKLDNDFFAKQAESIEQKMKYWLVQQRYRQSHLGMTSYQKWHKSNKKWRRK